MTRAVDDKASASLPQPVDANADDAGAADKLRGTGAEDQPPHRPEPPKRELQPHGKEQKNDPELGERLDRVRIRDGHIV